MRLRPRPAELVLLAFVGYCLLRAALGGRLPATAREAVPRGDIFVALLFVLTVRLGLRYKDLPWPPELAERKRTHSLLLVGFLLAGLLPSTVVFTAFPRYLPHLGQRGGSFSELLLFVYACVRLALAFLVPGAFLWLVTGLHVKRHGCLRLRVLAVEGAPAALDVLRDWAPPLLLIYTYVALGPMLSQRLFPDRDATVAAIDRFLFLGHDPSKLCEALVSRPLSEWLSGAYTFYLPLYPLVLGSLYAMRDRAPFREGAFALSVVLSIGYVGYSMVPVAGPLFTETFDKSLDLYYTAWIKDQLMDRTRVPRDCFPSLHTGASLILLWAARRHVPKLAWALAPIVLSIPFACVYLRYHYVSDVLAGLALFAAVAVWTSRSNALQTAFRR